MKSFWKLFCTSTSIAATLSIVAGIELPAQESETSSPQSVQTQTEFSQGIPFQNEASFGTGAKVDNGSGQVAGQHQTRRPLESNIKPVVTRQTRFGIPFNITDGALVSEVHLYTSADSGKTWRLYNRQMAGAKEFPFQTSQDGEFWFSIKTVDINGKQSPAGDPTVEMIVLVDTTNPQLNFNVHPDTSGRVDCWWLAADPTLNADSIEVKYRPHAPFRANIARWKTAELKINSRTDNPGKVESRASFYPETESLTLDVQAKITDRSGNVSVVDRRILLSKINQQVAQQVKKQRPPSVDPYAAKQDRISRSVRWNDEHQRKVATNQTGWTSSGSTKAQNELSETKNIATKVVPEQIESQSPHNFPPRRDDSYYSTNQQLATSQPDQGQRPRQTQLTSNSSVNNNENFSLASDQQDRSAPDKTTENYPRQTSSVSQDNIRLSNSRKFQLDYELDAVGPAGVAKVNIWITEDEGRNWYVWGQDEDKQSPVIVSVNNDGVFGFRIGVTSQDGLTAQPPRSGDQADVWIGVDTTKPTAEITSVPYGKGADAGRLIIQYEVADRQLAQQPVSLFYATDPDGPWTSIANRISNEGIYKWRITESLPREVYLRLEVQDTANNRGVYILDKPINLAGLIPRGRIRSVQPIN